VGASARRVLGAILQFVIYLDDAAVRRLLRIEELLPAVRQALIDLSAGRVRQPLRMVMEIAAEQDLLFLKPVLTREVLAVKLITQVPANAQRGLPTMLATLVLMDPSTGRTLAVMEATWLTALRTAAVSAVGVDALSAPGAKVVALLGSGALARTHALALRAVRPVSQMRVWSRDAGNAAACARDIDALRAASAQEAVRDADIVCTLTNAAEPVLEGAWLKKGAVVAAVGAVRPNWRELDDEAMRNVVIADSREAALQESGDVVLSGAGVYAEIGEILAATMPRPAQGTTMIFKALGQAVVDAVAARLVYEAQ
jgi:thiomorpholine-carboxylate dehydrogenase